MENLESLVRRTHFRLTQRTESVALSVGLKVTGRPRAVRLREASDGASYLLFSGLSPGSWPSPHPMKLALTAATGKESTCTSSALTTELQLNLSIGSMVCIEVNPARGGSMGLAAVRAGRESSNQPCTAVEDQRRYCPPFFQGSCCGSSHLKCERRNQSPTSTLPRPR